MTGRVRALLAAALLGAAACSQNATPPPSSSVFSGQAPGQTQRLTEARTIAADLPLLPPGIVQGVRPIAMTKAAFEFAARHPEVLRYIPCFCGCDRGGHKGNHDCFVAGRNAAGQVTAWEPHGIVCEMCIDIGYLARQMHNGGASVASIRQAVEQRYPGAHQHTPTPNPPRGGTLD
jgi:hypothetical protein